MNIPQKNTVAASAAMITKQPMHPATSSELSLVKYINCSPYAIPI